MTTKKKRTPHSQNDRWVVIAADSAVEKPKPDDSDPTFVRLRNPSTNAASLYLLGSGDGELYEVKAFNEDVHSWFIGQTVQRDGRLLFVTPLDPLYLLLPYLIKASKEGKFQPVEQLVMDEDFPACTRLLSCTRSLATLHHVAEEKDVGSQKFHRYSQQRTLDWLQKKAERTVKTLRKRDLSVGDGVKSSTYVRVKHEPEDLEEDFLRYAHGLISDYISEDLSVTLHKHLQLPELASPKEVEPPSKKRKLSDKPVEAGEDYTKFNSSDFARKPPKKMSAAQKTLAKVDKTGMKSMSAFFSPKGKAEKK
ncbi:hypothetical protein DPEC_G00051950 [Dallia pectoralis]|uniref:Uncharacterized protein n=1 Tax=Dallia pectoralis TaxID=75939 RepID=A0ACC2HC63_DALPE|nr:hypothetical protein DPEC_G00051950 [Dallia pectoralis]